MLDLGTLVAFVEVDTSKGDRSLDTFERKLLQKARQQVPDVQVNADTTGAVRALDDLSGVTTSLPAGEVFVDAVVQGALGELGRVASEVRGLPDGQVSVDVDSDSLDGLADEAGGAGRQAGDEAGEGLSAGIIAAIATIPVAGAIVGIGAAIGSELLSGLQNEVREDRLVATTGLDPVAAARIGRAAGEAYAGNFGESIEANFDTARVAIQGGLLDPQSTARDSQNVIQSLSGVADILGEDIPRVVRATSTLLRSGLVDSADEAFDLLVKGQQSGANAAEDLLDTFTEYPAVLERLGLSGEDALGLISQGLRNGARDSDFVADALKEFQIRATDASESSARGFERIGLNAEEMTAKIAAGGDGAREGLQQVLDGLRAIEDPVERNAAAVELFGTKAEDLGDSLFALDLNTVATDLGKVEGAASGAISALGDNAAGQLESAQRNIELAKDGILGALAEAFGPQIEGFATFVTENREAVVGFLLDVANGAFDAGRALVEAAAVGVEGFGAFITDTGPAVIAVLAAILGGLDAIPGVDLSDAVAGLQDASDTLQDIGPDAKVAADALRENLINKGIDPAQAKLNEVGIPLERQAAFTDATTRLAGAVAEIGYKADDTSLAIDFTAGTFSHATEEGRLLDEQIRTAVDALEQQIAAGELAGRTTEELTADYDANRAALADQLEAMGLTEEQAYDLIDAYGATPDLVETTYTTPGSPRAIEQAALAAANVRNIPGRKDITVSLTAPGFDAALARIRSGVGGLQSDYGDVQLRVTATRTNQRLAGGGPVVGPGTATSDSVPILASNGEFVMRAAAVDAYGMGFMQALNDGTLGAFADGGYVGTLPGVSTSPAVSSAVGDTYNITIVEAASARRTGREVVRETRLASINRHGMGGPR